MSLQKYTKSLRIGSVDFGDKLPVQDAVYIGGGNFGEGITSSEVFSPKLWLKSDNGPTYSGFNVATWVDKSGNSNDGSVLSGKEPTKQTNTDPTMNGLNTVDFNSSSPDDTIKVSDSTDFDFDGDFEMMVLAKWDYTGGNNCVIAKDKHSSTFTWINDDGIMKFHISGNDGIGSATISAGTWYIVGVSRSGTSIQMWLDGNTDGSSVTNSVDLSGTDDVYIGARLDTAPDTLGQGHDGEIAEVLIWKKYLSSSERSFVITYLQDKWLNANPPADITLELEGESQVFRNIARGTIIEQQFDTIASTRTNASSIVGLKK